MIAAQEHHALTGDERPEPTGNNPSAERDEHYDRYLREREAMLQQPVVDGANGHSKPALNVQKGDQTRTDDQVRRDAVDELLKSLGQTRSS